MRQNKGPEFIRFFGPIIQVMRTLGGSGTASEIVDKSLEVAQVTEAEQQAVNKNGLSRVKNHVHENSHLDAPPGRAGMKNACCRRQQESGRVVAWPSGEAATVCTTLGIIWSGLPSIGTGYCRGRFGSEYGSCFARLPRIMDLRWRHWRSIRTMSICF